MLSSRTEQRLFWLFDWLWSEVKSLSRVRLFATPWAVACQAPPSMEFSGKNTEMGCHFLLQGIFPTQGLNPGLLHCRQMLYHLSHQGSHYKVKFATWNLLYGCGGYFTYSESKNVAKPQKHVSVVCDQADSCYANMVVLTLQMKPS